MFNTETVRQLFFIFPIYLAETLFACIYMESFFSLKYSKLRTRLLFCLPCLLFDCALFVFLPNTSAMYNLAWLILRPAIFFLGQALLFYRREIGMHIYVTASIMSVIYIARHLISIPFVIVSDLLWGSFMPWMLNSGHLDKWLATSNPDLIHRLSDIINNIFMGLDSIWGFVLIFFLLYFLGKAYIRKDHPLKRNDTVYLCAPCVTSIVITITVNGILQAQSKKRQLLLYNESPVLRFWFLLIAVLLLATIYLTIILFQRELKSREELQIAAIQQSQIDSLTEEIDDLNRIYGDLRSLRHDLNNHIENLNNLYLKGASNEEINAYLMQMKATTDKLAIAHNTGHAVCDIILQRKETAATKADISFMSDFSYPNDSALNAYDVGVILDNALDNAITAATDERLDPGCRFIRIRSYQRGHLFFIEVKNSFSGALSFDPKTKLPRRAGNNDSMHGLGLATIQRMADKYLGGVQTEVSLEGNLQTFCLTVMMKTN